MGLSNFPGASEGVLPVLVMNTVLSVALLKSVVRSVFQVMSGADVAVEEGPDDDDEYSTRERRVSVSRYGQTSRRSGRMVLVECCVCLCGFEADQEVSELSCKHFFHKSCLDKWFDNDHTTCPLCRSVC